MRGSRIVEGPGASGHRERLSAIVTDVKATMGGARGHLRLPRMGILIAFGAGLLSANLVIPREVTAQYVAGKPRYWITCVGTIRAISRVDPRVAREVFGSPAAIALGGWGWPGALSGRSWASYEEFAADVRDGSIPAYVRIVMYDPERWDATPIAEQRDPITYIRAFTALAHEHGYFAVITPHPGLMEVDGAVCGQVEGETIEQAYIRCEIAGRAARYADALETQAQALQRDPPAYRAFVAATAAQARAANPHVLVLSGLSTQPGYPATPQMLYAAWRSVDGIVDGHYLSLARGRRPDVAAAFLRMVEGMADAPPSPTVEGSIGGLRSASFARRGSIGPWRHDASRASTPGRGRSEVRSRPLGHSITRRVEGTSIRRSLRAVNSGAKPTTTTPKNRVAAIEAGLSEMSRSISGTSAVARPISQPSARNPRPSPSSVPSTPITLPSTTAIRSSVRTRTP